MSNSSLVSGLSEASGVKFSLVEVPQESQKIKNVNICKHLPIEGLLKAFGGEIGYQCSCQCHFDSSQGSTRAPSTSLKTSAETSACNSASTSVCDSARARVLLVLVH